MLSIIVAVANNNVIGKDNKLIWHLPEDLKRFKALTTGHTIIMGRKTFESLGKVLPDRKHIVFTQNPDFKVNDNNVEIVHSLLQIQDLIEGEEEAFIIGGAMIYNFLMLQTFFHSSCDAHKLLSYHLYLYYIVLIYKVYHTKNIFYKNLYSNIS